MAKPRLDLVDDKLERIAVAVLSDMDEFLGRTRRVSFLPEGIPRAGPIDPTGRGKCGGDRGG